MNIDDCGDMFSSSDIGLLSGWRDPIQPRISGEMCDVSWSYCIGLGRNGACLP